MKKIEKYWLDYNVSLKKLKDNFNQSSDLTKEFGIYLIKEFLKGKSLSNSNINSNVVSNTGMFYYVVSRKITIENRNKQYCEINTWYFKYLIVILFDENGNVYKAFISRKNTIKKYFLKNNSQKTGRLNFTSEFINDKNNTDITNQLRESLKEKCIETKVSNRNLTVPIFFHPNQKVFKNHFKKEKSITLCFYLENGQVKEKTIKIKKSLDNLKLMNILRSSVVMRTKKLEGENIVKLICK